KGALRFSEHFTDEGHRVFLHACRHALEGIVSKRVDSRYEQRRSRAWLKIKCLHRQEFVVGGFTAPAGSPQHFGALLLGHHDAAGSLVYCGRVGTGFSDASRAAIAVELEARRTAKSPFHAPPQGAGARDVRWVQPELVVEV